MNKQIDFSIVLLTYKRDDILEQQFQSLARIQARYEGNVEVVLVDNNNDGLDRSNYFEGLDLNFKIIVPEENLGVAGGRNLGMDNSDGKLLLFIDDDALLQHEDVLKHLENEFKQDAKLGIIAGKSYNPIEQKYPTEEIPHTNKNLPRDESWPTFRFIGVVHCIKAEVIEHFRYDNSFFYGMEEMDLSFSCIQGEWSLRYDPYLYVHHYKHPSGRILGDAYWYRVLTNKLKVVNKYYPFFNRFYVAVLWLLFITYKTKKPFKTLRQVLKVFGIPDVKRNVLTKASRDYIKKVGGSLLR